MTVSASSLYFSRTELHKESSIHVFCRYLCIKGIYINYIKNMTVSSPHLISDRVSCDEGYTWLNYSFTAPTKKIRVVALFTEYGEESQYATIFGYYYPFKPSTFEWLIVDLNFTTLNLSQCTKDDYYIWKPTDEVHEIA